MIDFNELNKKRIVYEIPGMEQARVVENRVYKTVNEADLCLDINYPADLRDREQRES